jgi:dihydroneopterin aldolase
MTKKRYATLSIRHLELHVNLGWRKKERSHEQAILLDLDIRFPSLPKACMTDDLEDTVCYAQLIEEIRTQVATKNYKLIEHLSAEIYTIAKTHLPKKSQLNVRIIKYPKVEGLTDGVCFSYGDEN